MKYEFSYIISVQFLGFRFHGWQKQTNAKTLHEMIDKSLSFVFKHDNFKTLGVGRTDAKVSANKFIIQLFIKEPIKVSSFLIELNRNLPNDIRAINLNEVDNNFNIIQTPKIKEYLYFFSFGDKNHPFAAPFINGLEENLDLNIMKDGAKLFEGTHYFHKYCTKPSEQTIFKRTIINCEIIENNIYNANFFPEESYVLKVRGEGFLRYQVRLIMGVLFRLGKSEISLDSIKDSLKENNDRKPLKTIAPSSGLQLYDIDFVK